MQAYQTVFYTLHLPHTGYHDKQVRIAFFSDLHSCCSAEEKAEILKRLDELHPDVVLCGGDSIVAVPGHSVQEPVRFLREIAGQYRLVIGTGNHEYRSRLYPETYGTMYRDYRDALACQNIDILENAELRITLSGLPLHLYGFDMPREYYGRIRRKVLPVSEIRNIFGKPDPDAVSILLAHNPRALGAYQEWGADLTLCGHYHGGIMRIGRHYGLISPELRPFPSRAYGHFQKNGKHVIISSGCGEHTIPVRVHNPREIVGICITT